MSTVLQDARFAFRSFVRTPGVVLSALASIALGIGASTAMFSVAHALFLRPLPYPDAGRLVILWNRSPGLGITEDWFSTAQYFDVRRGHGGFDQVAIAIGANDTLTGDGEPERLGTLRVSSNLLPMLGARPVLGRLFVGAEDAPGAQSVAILGHGTWLRRYGGDPTVVGRTIVVNGQPHQVVGVLPGDFRLPREVMPTLDGAEDAEVVLPLPLAADAAEVRTREDYNIIGRLRPEVTLQEAQAEMATLTARLRRDHADVYPPNGGLTFGIVPLQEQVVGGVRNSVALLVASVGCVLLIACANVANLLLARAVARQRELAVRQAIGAGRWRIVRQLLTESVLLAVSGGACGLGLSFGLVWAIRAFGAGSVPRLDEVGVDGRALAFSLVASVGAGIAFGLAPAWRAGRADLHESLKDGARGASGTGSVWGRGQQARRLLVVSELGLSVMLLVGAGLLARSFAALYAVDPGFTPAGVLTLELTMTGRRYGDAEKVLDAYRRLWRELDALPGVTASGAVSALPLSQMFSWGPITVEGRVPPPGERFINVDMRVAAGRYFEAMRIPLLSGRRFSERDTRATDRVVIVDAFMAEQLWPGQDAVGKRIRLGGTDSTAPWATVVGIVGRVKQYTLDADSRMAMYLAHSQFPARPLNVVVRAEGDPSGLSRPVKRALASIDPDLPMYRVRTMEARVAESLATRRFALLLLGGFALVAVGLASVGIAGVMSYLVNQGVRDLGIRLALGARPADLVRLVVGQGMALASMGVAVGLAGACAATRLIRSLLFGVAPADPLTFAAAVLVLVAVALAASYGPARRASRIDPMVAIRE